MKFKIICNGWQKFESAVNGVADGFCSEKAAIKKLREKWSGIEFKDGVWINEYLSDSEMSYSISKSNEIQNNVEPALTYFIRKKE